MRKIFCVIAGIIALSMPASALADASPGVVTPYEYNHAVADETKADVQASFGTTGTLTEQWSYLDESWQYKSYNGSIEGSTVTVTYHKVGNGPYVLQGKTWDGPMSKHRR